MVMSTYAVLKPVSHPQFDVISITEKLISIGRGEAWFKNGDADVVNRLDRKHARIFLESDNFYLIDLGSQSGTMLNNDAVGNQPLLLRDGDVICFAGILSYKFKMGSALGATTPYASPLFVSLLPALSNESDEKVVLTHFPVLISRDSGFFALYKDKSPNTAKFLSRRHACLYVKGRQLYVEDLGSTNGTWVDGVKIEAFVAVKLHDGQKIVFGSDRLAYAIQIESEASAKGIAVELTAAMSAVRAGENTSGVLWINKTVYPTLADSFLDIFYDDENAQAQSGEEEEEEATVLEQKPAAAIGKIGAFSREIKEALAAPDADTQRKRPMFTGWLAAALCLAIIAGGGLYLYGKPKRELKNLLEQGQYQRTWLKADDYLAQHPGDKEVRELAGKALVKAIVPQWLEHLQEKRFADATALLDDAEDHNKANPDGLNILSLLAWAGDLQQFTAERGGIGEPLQLFKHEAVIGSLLQRRETSASEQDLLMAKIADYEPRFQDMRDRLVSQLRVLRNDQSVYLPAMAQLKTDLTQRVAALDFDGALEQLDLFERRYPKIGGIDLLRDDIGVLAQLQHSVEAGNLSKVLQMQPFRFNTPLVDQFARTWMSENLPPEKGLQAYRYAMSAWTTGDSARALVTLEPLTTQVWGKTARAKIKHFKQVSETFAELEKARDSADYGERLLQFQKILNDREDRYYLDRIAKDVKAQRDPLLAKAQRLFEQARLHWLEYHNQGGISGLLRLEKELSDNFKLRSEQLANAYSSIAQSVYIYNLLERKLPEQNAKLYGRIVAESRLQRQWLSDLAMVLQPELLDAKLRLLPAPESRRKPNKQYE